MQPLDYRIPRDDRGDDVLDEVPVSRSKVITASILVTCALSIAAWFVVMQGASNEPYFLYRRYDALVQLGLGTALVVLWCCWSITVVVLVRTRLLHAAWLLLLLWAGICLLYLSQCPIGYIQDMEQFLIPPSNVAP